MAAGYDRNVYKNRFKVHEREHEKRINRKAM
jgi:hypothetical protein